MDNVKRQVFYGEMLARYHETFAGMDVGDLASFLVSMESDILSFVVDVHRETCEQARERHDIKVLAIATALSNHPCASKFQSAIEALREVAGARLARNRHARLHPPTPDPDILRVQAALKLFKKWGL